MQTSIRHQVGSMALAAGLLLSPHLYAAGLADDDTLALHDVSELELDVMRGRDDLYAVQIGQISESASLNQTSANGNLTGSNTISDAALSGLNGFATVIQNTGNNVIIQDAMVINVQIQQ